MTCHRRFIGSEGEGGTGSAPRGVGGVTFRIHVSLVRTGTKCITGREYVLVAPQQGRG